MQYMYEILEEIASTRSTNEKKSILLNNNNVQFVSLIRHIFDKSIKFGYKTLPEYTPSDDPHGYTDTNLYREISKIDRFYEENVKDLPDRIAERQLVYLLEGLHAKEAEILSKLILGKLKVSGLTERLVRETFPELLSEKPVDIE